MNIIWFNSSYSAIITTKIGNNFLEIFYKHFPKSLSKSITFLATITLKLTIAPYRILPAKLTLIKKKILRQEIISQRNHRIILTWLRNNCNTHIAHISWGKCKKTLKLGQLIEYYKKIIVLQKLSRKCGKESSFRPLFIF